MGSPFPFLPGTERSQHWAFALALPKESSSQLALGLRDSSAASPVQRSFCSPRPAFQPSSGLYFPSPAERETHHSPVSSLSFAAGPAHRGTRNTTSRAMQLAGLQSWLLAQPAQELVPRGTAALPTPVLPPSVPVSHVTILGEISNSTSDSGPELYPVSKSWVHLCAVCFLRKHLGRKQAQEAAAPEAPPPSTSLRL